MFISADTMAYMLSLGLSGDQLVQLFRKLEDDARAVEPAPKCRTAGAERQRRYRERHSAVTNDVTDNATGDGDSDVTPPLPPSPSSPEPSSSTSPNQLPPYTPQSPEKLAAAKPTGFAAFWGAYPNKTAKRAAEKAYANAVRRIPGADPLAVMIAGIDRAKRTRKWREGFIPNPTTWLNGDCWEDDPDGELARAKPSGAPRPEPAVLAAHVRHFRDTGEWKPSWGEKPKMEDAA